MLHPVITDCDAAHGCESINVVIVSAAAHTNKELSVARSNFLRFALLALLASIDLTNAPANDDLKW